MFSENLVEFVDILPTLVEAAGLPELEKCPVDSRDIAICREGTSLLRIPEGIRKDMSPGPASLVGLIFRIRLERSCFLSTTKKLHGDEQFF